jgi:ABC-2 type transport system permease protein
MSYFNKLVLNEHIKQFKRRRSIVLFGALFFMNFVVAVGMKYVYSNTNFTYWEFMNASTYLIFLLNFVVVIFAGDIVSSEFTQGTIKMLLTRPAKRIKILHAKYVTVLLSIVYVVTIHLLLSMFFGLIFFFPTFLDIGDGILSMVALRTAFGLIEMIVIASFTMMLSVISRSSLFSVSFSIFFLMSIKLFLMVMSHYQVVQFKYLVFANANLSQYFYGDPMFFGMTLNFSIMNILIHMVLFYLVSAFLFTKRDV